MRAVRPLASLVAVLSSAAMGFADPAADTCRLLEVTGQNKVDEVEPLINELADRWAPQYRDNAVSTLEQLLREVRFDGGNAYVIATLGEDYEDHILAIRIVGGELAAARLTYEWTPKGMRLTVMNFKRRMSEMLPVGMPASGSLIDCS